MIAYSVSDKEFAPYGRGANGYPVQGLMRELAPIVPEPGQRYCPREERLHRAAQSEECGDVFFGGLPYEWGWYIGKNEEADTMVFHSGSALVCGLTDWTLRVALRSDIVEGRVTAEKVLAFTVPANTVIDLYPNTLRSAPIGDVRLLVGLSYATNTEYDPAGRVTPLDALLTARNTWQAKVAQG